MPGDSSKIIAVKLGALFHRYREDELGVSLRTVADATGIHQSTIYRIESGDLTKPSFEDVAKLTIYYRIPMDEVFGIATGIVKTPKPVGQGQLMQTLCQSLLAAATDTELRHVVIFLQSYIRFIQAKSAVE